MKGVTMKNTDRGRDVQKYSDVERLKRDRTPSIERKSITNIAGKINTLESKMCDISKKFLVQIILQLKIK